MTEHLSVAEAVRTYKVPRSSLMAAIRAGKIVAHQEPRGSYGSRLLVEVASLEAWVGSRKVKP